MSPNRGNPANESQQQHIEMLKSPKNKRLRIYVMILAIAQLGLANVLAAMVSAEDTLL